jgi:hypothetical protein
MKNKLKYFFLLFMAVLFNSGIVFAQWEYFLNNSVEMTDNQKSFSGFASEINQDFENNPRYKKETFIVNVPGYGPQQQVRYVDKEDTVTMEEAYGNEWDNLKRKNAPAYYFIKFFNPPFLNNLIFAILTIMFAAGSLFFLGSFEGTPKFLIICLSLYCWGRILSFFISFMLLGKGILSP